MQCEDIFPTTLIGYIVLEITSLTNNNLMIVRYGVTYRELKSNMTEIFHSIMCSISICCPYMYIILLFLPVYSARVFSPPCYSVAHMNFILLIDLIDSLFNFTWFIYDCKTLSYLAWELFKGENLLVSNARKLAHYCFSLYLWDGNLKSFFMSDKSLYSSKLHIQVISWPWVTTTSMLK